MWVKICANTSFEDAKLAAELGADAVGFVFAPSKRQVTPQQAAEIVPHLPKALEKIGVFTAREAEEIARIARAAGLTGVQLHGSFDLELARRLKAELGQGTTIVQTLHWAVGVGGGNAEEVAAQWRELAGETAVDRALVDSKAGGSSGGSGIRFDWTAARETLAGGAVKLIVAGGLHPENVAAAIAALGPWGVDVASGVEASPGKKDSEKLRRFIENARGAR